MSEDAIVKQIKDYLNTLSNIFFYKTHGNPYEPRGRADITGCYLGRRFEFEVKQPGELPRPDQLAMMRKWRKAGAICGFVHSVEEVKRILSVALAPRFSKVKIIGNAPGDTRGDDVVNDYIGKVGTVVQNVTFNPEYDVILTMDNGVIEFKFAELELFKEGLF